LLKYDTAGDPMTGIRWSHRTTLKIADSIRQQYGIDISPKTVARLLREMDYSLRVNQKKLAADSSPDRSLQFDCIAELRNRFERGRLPIISVDSKKRELVGNFKNPGACWTSVPRLVYDHDFRTNSCGVALPYGVYDPRANHGSLFVGVSHDTPAFAAHSIADWWRRVGLMRYPHSRKLLILADSGGSNGYRARAWKTELQAQLADPYQLTITVAHYPTGASKWNPIEHRLFPEISKNWAGEPLDSYQKILNFIRTTETKTGLSVSAFFDRRRYDTKQVPTPEQLSLLRLYPNDILPRWNYSLKPNL
jgi:Rhodopirellula transposase DDE domain